jgi:hypothetical protein
MLSAVFCDTVSHKIFSMGHIVDERKILKIEMSYAHFGWSSPGLIDCGMLAAIEASLWEDLTCPLSKAVLQMQVLLGLGDLCKRSD